MDMASSDIRLETKKRTIHGNALGLLAWLQKRNICSRRPCVDKKTNNRNIDEYVF